MIAVVFNGAGKGGGDVAAGCVVTQKSSKKWLALLEYYTDIRIHK